MNFEDIFKRLVWDALVRAATQALFKAVPWLAWGPLGIIVSTAIGYIADKLFVIVVEYIDIQAIQLKNAQHHREFTESVIKLKELAEANGDQDPLFIEAREEAMERLSRFVKFNA